MRPIAALAIAFAGTAFSASLALAGPQDCPDGSFQPDPPMFRAQGRIVDYASLDEAKKADVNGFRSLPTLPGLVAPTDIFRFVDDQGRPAPKNKDTNRTAADRYLRPEHPYAQPNTPMSEWRRVRCVAQVAASKLPFQWAARDGSADSDAAAFAAKHLKTLPAVHQPDFMRVTYVRTGPSVFTNSVDLEGDGTKQPVDRLGYPPGTNMLPTVYTNLFDSGGTEIANTLASTKEKPYALQAAAPQAVRINAESPIDDLRLVLEKVGSVVLGTPYKQLLTNPDALTLESLAAHAAGASDRLLVQSSLVRHDLKWAVDIVEGNGRDGAESAVPGDRSYRGFPLLNHSGHKRVNRVMPIYGPDRTVVGGEAHVRQIWYGGHVQSDTMFFDFGWNRARPGPENYVNCGGKGQPSQSACEDAAPIPPDRPWTIVYEISVLDRGRDDFSPMTMQFDCPWNLSVGGEVVAALPHQFDVTDGQRKLRCRGANEPGPSLVRADPADPKKYLPISWAAGPLFASFDQTFFPMEEGTRVTIPVRMAPPQYYNLTYTWGWRNHPPRAQSVENSHKVVPPGLPFLPDLQMDCHPLAAGIVEHERWTFEGFPTQLSEASTPDELRRAGLGLPGISDCLAAFRQGMGMPNADGKAALGARLALLRKMYGDQGTVSNPINRISDLAPEKRMWRAFRAMQTLLGQLDTPGPGGTQSLQGPDDRLAYENRWLDLLLDARDAYLDWLHRTQLPSGVVADPDADLTLLFVNNTVYGQITAGGVTMLPNWRRRGDLVKVTLLNGDYFPHGYLNVDFGGARGWENSFKSSVKTAGSGQWFSFGRFHSRFSTVPGAIVVDPAAASADVADPLTGAPRTVTPGVHRVMLEMNFEPSARLRMYQFDPLHHDQAIYSVH